MTTSMGPNVEQLLNRTDDPHCFRLHKDRVYYIRWEIVICWLFIVKSFFDYL